MGEVKVGDIVGRKSYGADLFFRVAEIRNICGENIVTLKGVDYRLQADAPESDLVVFDEKCLKQRDGNRVKAVVGK